MTAKSFADNPAYVTVCPLANTSMAQGEDIFFVSRV
jgi:hypothetical protein